jgi:hypothetical protein
VGSKKKRTDRRDPPVSAYPNPKGYGAIWGVRFKRIGRLWFVFLFHWHARKEKALTGLAALGLARDSPGRLLRRRGWAARVGGVGGEVAEGRGGLGRRFKGRGVGFQRRLGRHVRRRRSQARSNGGASGELCAGKRFVRVSWG